MNIPKMLAEMRAEYGRLEEAIITLERLAIGRGDKRRGRPPIWMAEMKQRQSRTDSTVKKTAHGHYHRKRKPFSAATRRRMAIAQRKRWAAKRAAV